MMLKGTSVRYEAQLRKRSKPIKRIFMQKLSESIPLLLLVGLVPYVFYNNPNIAQSIILAAITGLVGYRYYLESLVKPDFEKIFKERLDEIAVDNDKKLISLLKDIKEVKENQSKLSIVKSADDRIKNFKW